MYGLNVFGIYAYNGLRIEMLVGLNATSGRFEYARACQYDESIDIYSQPHDASIWRGSRRLCICSHKVNEHG
jgi:hypothetical protein